MKQLNLNGSEVIELSMEMENIKSNLADIFNNIYREITFCANNLVDEETGKSVLNNNVDKLRMKCMACCNALIVHLGNIGEFVEEQVKEYSASTEDAQNAVTNLISKIESLLSGVESGNIYGNASSSNSNPADFKDQVALANGKINYEQLVTSQINTPEQYETMDKCYEFFKEKGLNEEETAAILGYMIYTSKFDLTAKNQGSSATGLLQWLDDRWPSDWSLDTQLNYIWDGLNGNPLEAKGITTVLDEMNKCSTVDEISRKFAIYYQGSGVSLPNNVAANLGEGVYYYYHNKATSSQG